MTNNEFYILVSCIAKTATTWIHDGTVLKMARAKGAEEIPPQTTERFCRDIRELLNDIEQQSAPPQRERIGYSSAAGD